MYSVRTLVQGSSLTTAAAVYYTAPTGTYTRITQISVVNVDTLPHTVTFYLATGAGAPSNTDIVVKSKTLQAGEAYVPYQILGTVMSPGTTLQAVTDANSVLVLKASGIELTS